MDIRPKQHNDKIIFQAFLRARVFLCFMAISSLVLLTSNIWAGSYADSAHGSNSSGVFRAVIGASPPVGLGYARGNCAHCHEQHASIEGDEPEPVNGPAPYALFAPFFDSSAQTHSYTEDDNFCFYCHNSSGSAQQVINYTYSMNFGCQSTAPTSIFEAMNQNPGSYHNLYDIYVFADANDTDFPWFNSRSNPCSACHNPHLARRNWYDTNSQDPLYSAIVKPSDHFALWGTTQTMGSVYTNRYEPPYCSNGMVNREPDGSSDAAAGRDNTPDYVAFCTDCHNDTNTINSTTLGRNVRNIDWSPTGDKHGEVDQDGGIWVAGPYNSSGGYVLSCLDCHEPHGSENVLLVRARVNGGDLGASIADYDTSNWGYLCKRCHLDDQALGGGSANKWGNTHHFMPDAPYSTFMTPIADCTECHDSSGGTNCQNCHYHGADIYISVGDNSGDTRRTF